MISSSPVNDIYYSLGLYLDHQILQRGVAFSNKSSNFYKIEDPALSNYNVYASPYKQWVSDFSISGAQIPTGVYINGNFANKGNSGLKIDYLNGRAIFSGGVAYSNLSVSGSYSVKDFNVYPTVRSTEQLIYETKFEINPSYSRTLSGLSKDSLTIPGIFITNVNFDNETYAFGGQVSTTININCVIISDSSDQLSAVGNLIVDEKYSVFPVLNKTPLNYFGDFNSGNYNYLSYISGSQPEDLAYICEADFYKLTNRDFSNRYPKLRVGLVDLQIKYVRIPNRRID